MKKSADKIISHIMEQAMVLNRSEGVEVYCCLQGNTNCLCLTVVENHSEAYTSRAFLTDEKNLMNINNDLFKMIMGVKYHGHKISSEVLQ